MSNLESAYDDFEKHVPHGDEAFMVLKARLYMEVYLKEMILNRVNDNDLRVKLTGERGEFRTGKSLFLIAQALVSRDQFSPEIPWKAIEILNNLRNCLAHELVPNSHSITDKMKNFIAAMEQTLEGDLNINQIFRLCAWLLIERIKMGVTPATEEDFAPFP